MATLVEKITDPSVHPQVVAGCLQLIESEVGSKSGLSGAAVKAGYKVVKTLKPGIIEDAVTKLLPEFATALQPMYERSGAPEAGERSGQVFSDHLVAHQEKAADALLGVTDRKAQGAKNQTLKKTYDRLRGSAKTHVTAAIPGLARTLGRFA
ncbi:DUF6918 family protein [Paraliomyxa miuraensis]|uniref:DUF6918 family protein n=1 Tax=Paraliomyxa miuraensis TaxID=376150 RepID=UPI00224D2163|nr:hypothetical protein [Paraliomyxa miuraensis]MCX4239788.1 hypothetical protein [Paraliomyxa miuraensis]